MNLLVVRDLTAAYGDVEVLRGIDLDLEVGGSLTILGRNGVGKSTLVNALMGLVPTPRGSILLEGHEIGTTQTFARARLGMAIVPQGRRLFPKLTVLENLLMGVRKDAVGGAWNLAEVYSLLPRLEERSGQLAGLLSGGEQQMVAIGRALLRNPKLLLLDEPSEGLAPRVVGEIADVLAVLRGQGMSLLVVEQNLALGLELADDLIVVDGGRVVHRGGSAAFASDRPLMQSLLGVM